MADQQHMNSRLHVVFFAFPLKDLIQPALNVAERLHREGVSITFVSSQYQISTMHSRYSNNGTEFQLVGFSEEEPRPPNFRPDSVAGIGWAWSSADRMRNSFQKLIAELVSVAKSPICIVSDHFVSWVREVAEQFHQASSLVGELPAFIQNDFSMGPHADVIDSASNIHKAAGVLVNTHEELERRALQAVRINSKLNPNMVEIFPIDPCLPIADHTSEPLKASV